MINSATGDYLVMELDRHGTIIRATAHAVSFSVAKAFAETQRSQAECYAFRIFRVLYDSRDPVLERWEVRP